jgi:hypothetical protein
MGGRREVGFLMKQRVVLMGQSSIYVRSPGKSSKQAGCAFYELLTLVSVKLTWSYLVVMIPTTVGHDLNFDANHGDCGGCSKHSG